MQQVLLFLFGATVGFIINNYFGPYLRQKAQNLATKEDVTEITTLVENVKKDYTADLESLKAGLQVLVTYPLPTFGLG